MSEWKAEIEWKVKQFVQQVSPSIETLARVAEQLEQTDNAIQLRDTNDKIKKERFHLIVLGRFKNGKSTFLNALLGRIELDGEEDGQGLLAMDDLPCTATLTRVSYGSPPEVIMVTMDGKKEKWSLKRYRTESSLREESEENEKFFANIREFEIQYPAELCRSGIVLMDSPGTDEDPCRDFITKQAVGKSDAVLVVFRSDAPAGESERDFLKKVVREEEGVKRCFIVVNRMNGRKVDDRLKRHVWDKLIVSMEGGEKYQGQDLTERDIYFVDCLKAFEGVRTQNSQLIEESGLAFFRDRLTRFLLQERFQVHVQRWVERADQFAQALEESSQRQLRGLRIERDQFEANYQACRPKLEAIGKQRNRLSTVFDNYSRRAVREAWTSFETMMNRMERILPDEVAKRSLPSLSGGGFWERFKTVTHKKQLAEEASKVVQDILKEQAEQWQGGDLPERLGPVFEDMIDEIRRNVEQIEQGFEEVNFTLTGWHPVVSEVEAKGTSATERIMWTVLGMGTGNLDWALYGGTLGWKGVLTGFLTEVGIGAILYVFAGVALGPAVLVGLIAGVLVNVAKVAWDADKVAEKIKRDTAHAIIQGNPKKNQPSLREQLESARPKIEESVKNYFEDIKKRLGEEVDRYINSQKQEIRTTQENLQRDSESQKAKAEQTQKQLDTIVECRRKLKEAQVSVRQL
ncbi:MAG: hypothetical protein HC893_01655 [Chloroflexaceae bacterium]|nr:hypothetical protein [Chloroflexaceae bacterium]